MSGVILTTADENLIPPTGQQKKMSKFPDGTISLPAFADSAAADNGTFNKTFRPDICIDYFAANRTSYKPSTSNKGVSNNCVKNSSMKSNGFLNHPSLSKVDSDQLPQKRTQRRLVFKSGDCNISHLNIRKRRRRFLADIFTTLVDIRWRWNLLLFALAFILSWLVFAMVWWIICFSHGDFENHNDKNWAPCVKEVIDFTSALLFSIETQHTIGYGYRHTTPNCPEAVVVMMVQSVFGVIIQALMTGLVFAKLQRPKKRAQTLMFSKNAVICQRDGQLCLLFRVGDMRKSHIIQSQVRAIVIKKKVTKEGEEMPLNQFDVHIGGDSNADGHLFLVWPMILEHRIDNRSPFWQMSADDLMRQEFELIVMLEGIVESTGMTTQARTSYVPGEILWGHRFRRLVAFQKDDGAYTVDFSLFNVTYPVPTPTCSARELELAMTMSGEVPICRDGSDEDSDIVDDASVSAISEPIGEPNEKRPPTPSILKWCEFGENGLEFFFREDERLVKHDNDKSG